MITPRAASAAAVSGAWRVAMLVGHRQRDDLDAQEAKVCCSHDADP